MIRRTALALVSLVVLGVVAGPLGSQSGTSAPIAFAYEFTFGETGAPWRRTDIYLNQPWGIGADGAGIWVANAAGRNLVRYGPGDVEALGRAGSIDELYGRPARWITDVAVFGAADGSRIVWFVDQGAHVVVGLVQPGPNGPWGPQVPIVLGEYGVPGDDAAHFRAPTGIALDARGDLFVSDTGNHRVQVFDPGRTLRATIGRPGVAGSGPDELNSPARMTVSADGHLYVADSGNHRVQAWDVRSPASPVFLKLYGQSGAPGSGPGQFDTPLAVAVDPTFLYVADSGNSRVQILTRREGAPWRTLDGTAVNACGRGDSAGRWHGPVSDVALDADQNLFVARPTHMTVQKCDAINKHAREVLGVSGVPYLAAPELHNAPAGVAVAPEGTVVVAEADGQRLVARDAPGAPLWTFGAAGLAGGGRQQLFGPSDVVRLSDGRWIVSDRDNGRLVVLGADGRWLAEWGAGTVDPLVAPEGLAVLADGRIAVADSGTGFIRLFDASGTPVGSLSDAAGRPLQFADPADVAMDGRGLWYVSERATHAVRVYDARGSLVRTVGVAGESGDDFGHLAEPRGIAIDEAGRLFVVDSGNNRVQVFDADGGFLTTVGGERRGGSGGLREPRGIALGPDDRIYVADTYNHRIQVFGSPDPPWAPAGLNGLGVRSNQSVTALAEFGGRLVAGTRGSEASGLELWARDAAGMWRQLATGGWGDRHRVAVTALARSGDQLYVGTEHRVTTGVDPRSGQAVVTSAGGDLYRSTDGTTWEHVASAGFGDARQNAITALASFAGHTYAGTRGLGAPPQLWRSSSGGPGSWTRVRIEQANREAWNQNGRIGAMAVFSNSLFVGTCGRAEPQVWATSDGSRWRPVGDLAIGANPSLARPQLSGTLAACVTSMIAFDGWLYAGVGDDPDPTLPVSRSHGPAELLRCRKCDGTDWEAAAAPGFGNADNRGALALAAFDEPPFRFLYAAVGNASTGVEVWRAPDGLAWEQSATGGWGDDGNADVGGGAAIHAFGGHLFIGTRNAAGGGEIWSTAGTRPGAVPTAARPTPTPTTRPRPQPPLGRAAYKMVAAWPLADAAGEASPDALGEIVDVAVADDGTVFLLDATSNRVLRLRPDGKWDTPFGGASQGLDRITQVQSRITGALAVDPASGRIYVGDVGAERIAVFTPDGLFATDIAGVVAVDIEVQPDGSLWVADLLAGAVRRLASDGSEIERFGPSGVDPAHETRDLRSVTEAPGGRVWVGDLGGNRLRAFERRSGLFVSVLNLDLTSPSFAHCSAQRIQALGQDVVLAGDCIIAGSWRREVLPTNHRGSDLEAVRLRTANVSGGHFVALARYDPDPLDGANPTLPVVVRYTDGQFRTVSGWWRGRDVTATTLPQASVQDPIRLSVAPDGSLSLSDALGLRRYTPDGQLIERLAIVLPISRREEMVLDPALRLATGEAGRAIGLGILNWRGRRPGTVASEQADAVLYGETTWVRSCVNRVCEQQPYLATIWDTTLPYLTARNYAIAHEPTRDQLVVLQMWVHNPTGLGGGNVPNFPVGVSYASRLLIYPLGRMGRRIEVDLPDDDRHVLWTDVDAGPDGRIVVLDTLTDRAQVFDAEGRDLGQIETPKDAWRVAAGPNGEVFILTTYGHIVRLAADGTVLSRFVGLPFASAPTTAPADMAVDSSGWVYVADTIYDRVTVFAPEGREEDVLEGERCHLAGDKWAAPQDILLGDTAEVWLSLFGSCGYVETPADIVLAVAADPWYQNDITNPRTARHILSLVDLDRHRVGLVGYAHGAYVIAKPTHDRRALIRGLSDVNAGKIPLGLILQYGCEENNYIALVAAKQAFEDAPGRRKVVVLVNPGAEWPGQHADCGWGPEDVARAAAKLTAMGVRIVAVNGRSVGATSEVWNGLPLDVGVPGAARLALRSVIGRAWPDHVVVEGSLTDRLPANMDYVPGSAVPAARWDAANRTLTWDLKRLARTATHGFRLTIRPREEGEWPTNVEAVADGTDGWGKPIHAVLPIPRIRVYGELPPTPTAKPPATATATTTPTPRPARPPMPKYLPVLLKTRDCRETRSADVALVIDTSVSMSDRTGAEGPTKLEAARDAALVFVGMLVAGRDQVAVIQYNVAVTVLVALTDDPGEARAALGRLSQAAGTRIDLALDAARAELTSPAHRPANNPVLILLTDGVPTGTTKDAVLAAAAAVHRAGILSFTVGLGGDVDADLLRRIASRPDWYYPAPDTSDLAGIYSQIAYQIPCQPDWP